jgi:uncharacterized membrane protein YcgQ (UPF0703/DUF1980 family)
MGKFVRRWIFPAACLTLLVCCVFGRGLEAGEPEGGVVEIREKMFIAQTFEIYLNAGDYLGKTLRYQGFFDKQKDELTGETYCFVLRNGPGCCPGVDNTAGFEVVWEGNANWPKLNDWVEVTGVLENCEVDGEQYLRVNLRSLNVLDVRGADYVTQ